MKRFCTKTAIIALLFLAGLNSAQAYVSNTSDTGQPQKWNLVAPTALVHTNVVNRNTKAVRYFLSASAYSIANRTAELNAARACFDQWQAVTNSILKFEEGGLMPGQLDVNTTDNTNVVFWAKDTTIVNGGYDNIAGATGVTFADYYSDYTLAEADIVLNGSHYTWFTDFTNTANQGVFVEAVLLHEIGHFIGLAHSPVGAATMFPRGGFGVSVQAGLSIDEIEAVHALYPVNAAFSASLGGITGLVSKNGVPVLGAAVVAEDATGNIAAGTVTRANGVYEMKAMRPGNYQVRVTPLDPQNASYFLFRGSDVRSTNFVPADVNFLATTNRPATVTAGVTTPLHFALTAGTPPLRIGRLLPPTADPGTYVIVNYPSAFPRGEGDWVVGVYSSDVPASNAVLRVTGDGLTMGPTTLKANVYPGLNPPLNALSASVHLSASATPGMRSLIVQQANSLAYANGFLEIQPRFPDDNFDGLDDRFQRQYFARWTAPEAGPTRDPDGDGFDNTAEYTAGSSPIDSASVMRVESVRYDASGATVTWPSAPGRKYQVLSRPTITSIRGWQPVGSPVIATGDRAQFLDTTATTEVRFYRVEAIPN